jgi:hypothetical protein
MKLFFYVLVIFIPPAIIHIGTNEFFLGSINVISLLSNSVVVGVFLRCVLVLQFYMSALLSV